MSHYIFFEREYAYFGIPGDYPIPFRVPISFQSATAIEQVETPFLFVALVRMEDESVETVVAVKERDQLTRAGLLPFAYSREQRRIHIMSEEDGVVVIRAMEGTYTLKYENGNVIYTLDSIIRLSPQPENVKPTFWRFNPWAMQTDDRKSAGFYAGITRNTSKLVVGFKADGEGEWKMQFSKGFVSPVLFEPKTDGTIQSLHVPLTLAPTEARMIETVDAEGTTMKEQRNFIVVAAEGVLPTIPLY